MSAIKILLEVSQKVDPIGCIVTSYTVATIDTQLY